MYNERFQKKADAIESCAYKTEITRMEVIEMEKLDQLEEIRISLAEINGLLDSLIGVIAAK